MGTKANAKKQSQPVTANADVTSLMAQLDERASHRKPRTTFNKTELATLKQIVANEKYSIKGIAEICSQSPLFNGKGKGSIFKMALAIRKNEELPYTIVD